MAKKPQGTRWVSRVAADQPHFMWEISASSLGLGFLNFVLKDTTPNCQIQYQFERILVALIKEFVFDREGVGRALREVESGGRR
ncbi:hypothetical protein RJ641_015117 [Dillenia turbinata]|uniref:Uncharacterized protein n=1 Tax=Dillenia turbinata TaxID=194707 RepID=A0AAN8V0Q0_9MAGN